MIQDFQEYEDISDFKASLFELTKEYFSNENISLQDVNIWLRWRKQPKILREYLPTSIQCIQQQVFTQTQRAGAVHRTA